MHHHTSRLADCRNNWLKKVCCPSSLLHDRRAAPEARASCLQAVCYLDEYNEMLDFIVRWADKARSLVRANIIWNSSVHLQEQIRIHQVGQCDPMPSAAFRSRSGTVSLCLQAVLRESRELHGDLESMAEKVELLSEVLQVQALSQQVCELSRHTDELQQSIRTQLQSLQDANKVRRLRLVRFLGSEATSE